MHDLVDKQGMAISNFCGRGKPFFAAERLALPRKTSAALGKTCIAAHALIWLNRRTKELADMSERVGANRRVSEGAYSQWTCIMTKVSAVTGLAAIVEKISPRWADGAEALRCHIPGRDAELLRQICADAVAIAHDMKQKHLEKRAESWRAFTLKQVMDGASIAHRLDGCGVQSYRVAAIHCGSGLTELA